MFYQEKTVSEKSPPH